MMIPSGPGNDSPREPSSTRGPVRSASSSSGFAMDIPRKPTERGKTKLYLMAGGALVLLATTAALSRLGVAAPTVEKSTVWIDTVQRGEMLRAVEGQGTLVPEEVRWLTVRTAARVDRVLVHPGDAVKADTEILVLSNPDVELQALEAERQAAEAQSELANLRANVQRERLAQESALATLRSDLGEARRMATADEELAKRGYLSQLELGQSKSKADDLASRLAFEEKRLGAMTQGEDAQIAAARQNVERMQAIADFRKRELDSLHVRAGIDGVLQELPLQVGQTVQPGATVAKVARPDKLMGEVRVPETLAKDLTIGQKTVIDTHVGTIDGKVMRIDPAAQGGTVKVDIRIEGQLPQGARPDQAIDATIELERIPDAVFVGRPAFGSPGSTVTLFKLTPGGDAATRVQVKLGRASVKTVEILGGLVPGDRVILSDMSQYDHHDHVQLR